MNLLRLSHSEVTSVYFCCYNCLVRSPSDESQDPDLGYLVMRLSKALRRRRMRDLEPFGLVAHQARAFVSVARASDHDRELRLTDLAARLHVAPRSATEVVDALEAKGLIERKPSLVDRRATRLLLTKQGRALRKDLERSRVDRSDGVFDALSDAERATLAALLAKAADGLDEQHGRHRRP